MFALWDRLAGVLTRPPAPRDALLGVPGEEHGYPHGWWEQVRAPFVRAPRALSPQPQSQRAA